MLAYKKYFQSASAWVDVSRLRDIDEDYEEEDLGGRRDEVGGGYQIPLTLESLITPRRRDAHVIRILRNYDVSRGPPPKLRDTEEKEDLDGEFLGRRNGKRRIYFYSRKGGGRVIGSGDMGYS